MPAGKLNPAKRTRRRMSDASLKELQMICQEEVSAVRTIPAPERERIAVWTGIPRHKAALAGRWRGSGAGRTSPRLESEANDYHIHPALLDACLQVMAAALPDQAADETYLPSRVASLRIYNRPGTRLSSHAVLRTDAELSTNTLEGDVRLFNEAGQIVAEVVGLRLTRLGGEAKRDIPVNLNDWFYTLE